jgi:hypothetical protein
MNIILTKQQLSCILNEQQETFLDEITTHDLNVLKKNK